MKVVVWSGSNHVRGARKINFNHVEYFLCVCKHLNFTTAAKELFISEQGLRMAIHRLERELGTKLFSHTPKGLMLTESGYNFELTATNIVNDVFNYKHRITNQGIINVICMPLAFTRLPMEVNRLLFNLDDTFNVALKLESSAKCETSILRNESDFAISTPFSAECALETQKLYTAEIMALVNKRSPLAKELVFRLEFLEKSPFIVVGSDSKICQIVTEQLRRMKITSAPAFICGSPSAVCNIVSSCSEIMGILVDYAIPTMVMQNIVIKQFNSDCMRFNVCLIKTHQQYTQEQTEYFEKYFFRLMKNAKSIQE